MFFVYNQLFATCITVCRIPQRNYYFWTVFQQTLGIPMSTTCAIFLADLFLYSHETDFIQDLFKK